MKTRTPGRQAQRQTDQTQTSTRGGISMPVMITSIVLVFALPRQTKVVEIFSCCWPPCLLEWDSVDQKKNSRRNEPKK
jgi:hypothetical protein